MAKIVDGVIVRDEDEKPFIVNVPLSDGAAPASRQQREGCPCKPGWLFIVMVVATVALGVVLYFANHRAVVILFGLSSWAVSLCLHEFGHAVTAYYGGDLSVKDKGYLTLDPLKYTTLMGSLIIPLFFLLIGGIGLPGGAVFIQTSALRSKGWQTGVSLAGPFATLMCGVLYALPFYFLPDSVQQQSDRLLFWGGLAFNCFIQFSAFFLNLVPLPPFDGFGAILPWLPADFKSWYQSGNNATYCGYAGLLLVFMCFWRIPYLYHFITSVAIAFGVPPQFISIGASAFRLI